MTSDLLALQALQRGLEGWRLTIERSTRGKLSLALHPRGGLTCRVTWEEGGNEVAYARVFSAAPQDPRACVHARSLIQEVLERRGVIT